MITITTPAKKKSKKGATILSLAKSPIIKYLLKLLQHQKFPYELKAAIGTPIKLTKSLPAKANASAKVPIIIITLKILTLNKLVNTWDKIVKTQN